MRHSQRGAKVSGDLRVEPLDHMPKLPSAELRAHQEATLAERSRLLGWPGLN